MTDTSKPGFTLKGWHVLAGFVAFFAVGIAVNIIFVVQAVTTFRGEEVERSYMQGLSYNDVLAAREAQSELGWQAVVNRDDDRLILSVMDANDQPVRGLELSGTLKHPTDMDLDRVVEFSRTDDGVYETRIEDLTEGRWVLSLRSDLEPPFEMEYELWQRSP